VDAIDLELTLRHPRAPVARLDAVGRPWWWRPNAAGLQRMAEAAGFRVRQGPRQFLMPGGPARPRRSFREWRLLTSSNGRQEMVESRLGDPHAWLLLEPDSVERKKTPHG
jgi:hypothetical protein